ncbi:uncharacterized protein LOC136041730 isoform X2 [Artemia franciscana]|uniref:uncharacterized protein LOC136041730 isoform X2 n=1 Tax=Artemia franciscana TaxID=6661 RepID=UPI0032DB3E4F
MRRNILFLVALLVSLICISSGAIAEPRSSEDIQEYQQNLYNQLIKEGPASFIRRSLEIDPNQFAPRTSEKDPEKLAKKYRYYQRPLYRYPYYDNTGRGYNLYGYGGPELFSYSIFQPIEGYY